MYYIKYLIFRFLFGRFSYTFQQFASNSDKPGATRGKYLIPCSKLSALNHYSPAASDKKNTSVFQTGKKIEFQDVPFNKSFRALKRQKRKISCYDISKYQQFYWRRIGYRERIYNTGVRLIYHCLANRFFFGEIFFSDASKVNAEMVATSLLRKYTDEKSVPAANFKIVGKNAFIYFENTGINISIKYIYTGNERLNTALDEIISFTPFTREARTDDLEDLL